MSLNTSYTTVAKWIDYKVEVFGRKKKMVLFTTFKKNKLQLLLPPHIHTDEIQPHHCWFVLSIYTTYTCRHTGAWYNSQCIIRDEVEWLILQRLLARDALRNRSFKLVELAATRTAGNCRPRSLIWEAAGWLVGWLNSIRLAEPRATMLDPICKAIDEVKAVSHLLLPT